METILITDIIQIAPPFQLEELTDYSIFYKRMATGMDDMLESISNNADAIVEVMSILVYLINLTTSVDFDVNQMLLDVEPIMRVTVYQGLITLPRVESQIYPGIKAVNNHTKKYINENLADFVNNDVWPGECVPYDWARASEITGEDISNWNICDPS